MISLNVWIMFWSNKVKLELKIAYFNVNVRLVNDVCHRPLLMSWSTLSAKLLLLLLLVLTDEDVVCLPCLSVSQSFCPFIISLEYSIQSCGKGP